MSTLAARVLEAIEAAEKLAKAAYPGPWSAVRLPDANVVTFGPEQRMIADVNYGRDMHFIAANDPDVVLRRCAADRKLIALHPKGVNSLGEPSCLCCETWTNDGGSDGEWPCDTLLTRAEAYGVPLEQEETNDGPQARG